MVGLRGRAGDAHGVVVPLGVGVPLRLVLVRNHLGAIDFRPAWYRVETPMDEDAQLRVGIPLRQRMLVERLEGWLIVRRLSGDVLGARDRQSCRGQHRDRLSRWYPVHS